MPSISVIMPAFNASKTIELSIESVLKQTQNDFELIIINDCSTDDTLQKIEEIAREDSRIRVYSNEINSGASFSRNYGVSVAKGDWIAFIDSDDLWREDKLKKQIELVDNNPDAVLTFTASAFINWEGVPFNYIMAVPDKIDYTALLKKNLLSCSSVLVKSELMKSIKMYDDSISEDYAAWLTILKKVDFAYGINEPLLIYRVCKKSKSSSRIKAAIMTFKTYRYIGYNLLVSLFLVGRYTLYSVSKRYKIKHT